MLGERGLAHRIDRGCHPASVSMRRGLAASAAVAATCIEIMHRSHRLAPCLQPDSRLVPHAGSSLFTRTAIDHDVARGGDRQHGGSGSTVFLRAGDTDVSFNVTQLQAVSVEAWQRTSARLPEPRRKPPLPANPCALVQPFEAGVELLWGSSPHALLHPSWPRLRGPGCAISKLAVYRMALTACASPRRPRAGGSRTR